MSSAFHADLLVFDQIADEQRSIGTGRASPEHCVRVGEEMSRMRVRHGVTHYGAIDPSFGPSASPWLSRAGMSLLEILGSGEGIAGDVYPDDHRPVGSKLRMLRDRDGDVVVLRPCDRGKHERPLIDWESRMKGVLGSNGSCKL